MTDMTRAGLILFAAFFISFIEAEEGCHAYQGRALDIDEVMYLVEAMKDSGLEHDYLLNVLGDPRIRFIPGLVKPLAAARETMGMYRRFLRPPALSKARQFAERWMQQLDASGQEFGVEGEIVIAILLVETGLGDYLGRCPVISVFTSIMLENSVSEYKCNVHDGDRHGCLKRLAGKADWARQELRALLMMEREFDIDIFNLQGSRAGAFGLAQFLPSSYVGWGHDGDCNQKIDLFCVYDAIASTMNYLKTHGWQYGLDDPRNRMVLWQYNHSNAYVETIMSIAAQLKSCSGGKKCRSAMRRSIKKTAGEHAS